MNKTLKLIILGLLLPILTFAATNDFIADNDITVSVVTFVGVGTADMLILNGSTAESWLFSSGTFTVTNPGSAFRVGSSDSAVKSIQVTQSGTTLACAENSTPGTSYATLPTTSGTYTVSPSATTQCTSLCTAVSNAASYNSFPTCGAASCSSGYSLSGSGASATCVVSGGLSGSRRYGCKDPNASNYDYFSTNDSTLCEYSSGQTAVSKVFNRDLQVGMSGDDVESLQQFLILQSTGISAEILANNGTTKYFGPLTKAALIEFQKAKGIVPSIGYFGPITKALVLSIVNGSPSTSQPHQTDTGVISTVYRRNLQLGMIGDDVRQLQIFLNTHGFLVATTNEGSPGKETTYFGPLTKAALIKFQNSNANEILVPIGLTQGTGFFGPSTIKFVNTILQISQ